MTTKRSNIANDGYLIGETFHLSPAIKRRNEIEEGRWRMRERALVADVTTKRADYEAPDEFSAAFVKPRLLVNHRKRACSDRFQPR